MKAYTVTATNKDGKEESRTFRAKSVNDALNRSGLVLDYNDIYVTLNGKIVSEVFFPSVQGESV